MKKLARLILLCLMMIAIPLQGIAASTMLYCGAEHHQSMDVNDGDHSLNNHAADDSSTADECSSCADCCVGCAPVMQLVDTAVSRPLSEKIDLIFSSYVGHISDCLERPPRA